MASLFIPVILGTTRKDNQSRHVANYIYSVLVEHNIDTILLDLGTSDFPLLTERVSDENQITEMLQKWTTTIKKSNGLVIVSPEYKSGYPGSLKNFLDYLPAGVFRYKPVGISTVSSGVYAGTSCLSQLRQVVISMAGLVIPDRFQVGSVGTSVNENDEIHKEHQIKACEKFVSELISYSEVMRQMQ